MTDSSIITNKQNPHHHCAVGRFLMRLSSLSAAVAAALLLLICAVSSWSVLARWLWDEPLLGDVEMVQTACAIAIAACLPYAQMKNAHVIVDFFTHNASERTRRVLDVAAALVLAAVAAVLAQRSAVGAWDSFTSGEITMILGWPQWWAHVGCAPALALLAVCALYTAWDKIKTPAPQNH